MNIDTILTVAIAVISSGALVAIINGAFGKRKGNADVTDIMVKKAMELEELSTKRYMDTNERLAVAEKSFRDAERVIVEMRNELHEVKKEIDQYARYTNMLKKVLDSYQISVPEWSDFVAGKTTGFEN